MRILFDQGTPVAIGDALQDHSVRTANAQGWSTLTNGELLRVAEEAGLEVLVTADTNLPHQQNMRGRKLAVVILTRNRWALIKPRMKEIVDAVNSAKPGTYSVVEIPDAGRSI
jgi:predicted nuclease of predicted toxin-antitoxin system